MIMGTLLSTSGSTLAATYDGNGTEESPYLIKTIDDLYEIPADSTAYYLLANDLDLGSVKRIPRGEFKGTLDGNNRVIKNLNIINDAQYTSLFTKLTNATVKNITFENAKITASNHYSAVLAGTASNSTISNIHIIDSVVDDTKYDYVAAIVGKASKSNISDCSVKNTSVKGNSNIGTICGYMDDNSVITNSGVIGGNVEGTGSYIGGVVGLLSTSSISQSYSTADINSTSSAAGGLLGRSVSSTIHQCYSQNSVEGTSRVGGLIGSGQSLTISQSFTKSTLNGTSEVGGLIGYGYTLTISQSFSECILNGTNNVAGLIGYLYVFGSTPVSTIENCYSASDITLTDVSTGVAGGLISHNTSAKIKNSYSASTILANTKHAIQPSSGSANTENTYFNEELIDVKTPVTQARTTQDMHQRLNYATWDFENIWTIDNGNDYPKLKFALEITDPEEPEQPTVRKIKVVLEPKEEIQFSVSANNIVGTGLTWTSSDESIATIDEDGIVKAVAVGYTTVTVKTNDNSYVETIDILVVKDATLYRLVLDLKTEKSCRLTVDDYKNNTTVKWDSMNSTIATVTNKGIVTGNSEGLTIITASDGEGNVIDEIYVLVK